MEFRKRLFTLLLAVVMVCYCSPLTAVAATGTTDATTWSDEQVATVDNAASAANDLSQTESATEGVTATDNALVADAVVAAVTAQGDQVTPASDAVFNVYEKEGGSDTATLKRSYTAADLTALATADAKGYLEYADDAWSFVGTNSSIPMDTLLSNAGIEVSTRCTFTVTDGLDGSSNTASFSGSWQTVNQNRYFFPSTTSTATNTATPVEAGWSLALDYTPVTKVTTTAGADLTTALDGTLTSGTQFLIGTSETDYQAKNCPVANFVSGAASITISNPPLTATTTELSGGSSQRLYTGSPVDFDGSARVMAGDITVEDAVVTYAYYSDQACTDPTTANTSGSTSVGGAPVNVGTWYVKGSYDGDDIYAASTSSAKFAIVEQIDIAGATVAAIPDQTYTGSAIEPALSVTYGDEALVAGTDYTVAYKSASGNVVESPSAPGTYTVTVEGVGSYTGTVSATFTIVRPSNVASTRLAGDTALDTMSEIVDAGFGDAKGGTVVLTTGSGYWDALTASGIAGLADAPVLLTSVDGKSLSSQANAELKRLAPATIIVCGGPKAVPDSIVSAAKLAAGTGPRTVCCSGDDAVGTANDIYAKAKEATGKTFGDTAFIATNDGYWDALACAPYAYSKGCPIFLTSNGAGATTGKDSISADTLAAMMSGGIKNVYIAGGTAAVSDNVKAQLVKAGFAVKDRLWGAGAVETSAAIANFELAGGMQANKIAVGTTDGYYDALTGAALCGKNNSVLVLANDGNRSAIDAVAKANKSSIGTAYVFGGTSAVSDGTAAYLTSALR